MKIQKIPLSEIALFSDRDLAYIEERPNLRPFFKYPVTLDAFAQVIEDKSQEKINREILVEVLQNQHKEKSEHALVSRNIESLADAKTFTVVTAHQPSLFTGPLYYILKILSTINLAENLCKAYPAFHFVPVFISSGEDHDFEEVNHLHLFGKTLTWESGEKGSVGQMKTSSLLPVLDDLKNILGESEHAHEIFHLIEKAVRSHRLYEHAASELAHELFKEYGLVVLNTNDRLLKQQLIPVIREEIFRQTSCNIVEQTIQQLGQAGYPSQATPRDINFFYLAPQIRERIVYENEAFQVLNTDIRFSLEEMEKEIHAHPERFSPNVIMRPIYQETILPNLAYIGGGGELAYWLERKDQFAHYQLNFPMLIRRDSAMWIDAGTYKKIEKTGLQISDLWKDTHVLIKSFLEKESDAAFSLSAEQDTLESLFQGLSEKAKNIDPSLAGFVLAEHAKAKKSLENIETRLLRAEKQKHENAISQITSIREKLFPGGGLQERYDNFLPFYLKHGRDFFRILKSSLDPLEKQFTIFIENE